MKHRSIRRRLFEVLSISRPGDSLSRFFDISILTLIILNVVAVVLETVTSIYIGHEELFHAFEVVSVMIFTVEYVGRIWTSVEKSGYGHPIAGRLRFALTPLMIVDLLAILPFYLPLVTAVDLRILRILRLLRVLRLLKLGRYFEALEILGRVLKAKKEELAVTGFVILLLLVLASSCMYYAENSVQPEAFPSIPATMWWGIATLTTVGYGDMVPVTPLGKLIGAFVAVLGVGMFALPAGILGGAFVEEMSSRKREPD